MQELKGFCLESGMKRGRDPFLLDTPFSAVNIPTKLMGQCKTKGVFIESLRAGPTSRGGVLLMYVSVCSCVCVCEGGVSEETETPVEKKKMGWRLKREKKLLAEALLEGFSAWCSIYILMLMW